MTECTFCAVAAGETETPLLHSDDQVVAFRDLNPQAPTHILVVPREHLESAADITPSEFPIWGRMLAIAQRLAEDDGCDTDGYRLVSNVGANGGQTVAHLHLHLIGGRPMTWPPG